jgi:hypothetical protein
MRSHTASIRAGVSPRAARQPGDVARRQRLQVLADDAMRQLARFGAVDVGQLQQQALRHAARTDARRIERLHAAQRDLHLLQRRRRIDHADAQQVLERACADSRRRRATRRSRAPASGRAPAAAAR